MRTITLENKELMFKKIEHSKKEKINNAVNDKYSRLKNLFVSEQTEFTDEEITDMVSCLEYRFKKSEKFEKIVA